MSKEKVYCGICKNFRRKDDKKCEIGKEIIEDFEGITYNYVTKASEKNVDNDCEDYIIAFLLDL